MRGVPELNQLLEEVDRASASNSREFRRDVLRRVSYFLTLGTPDVTGSPGTKRLREFRNHPFRGLQEAPDLAPSIEEEEKTPGPIPTDHSAPSKDSASETSRPTPLDLAGRTLAKPLEYRFPLSKRREASIARDRRHDEFAGDYRTFLRFTADEGRQVKDVLNAWLRDKEIRLELGVTHHDSTESRGAESLTTVSGETTLHRIKIVERQPEQHFNTEIILGEELRDAWLWINIWSDGDRAASPPRFVSALFQDKGVLGRSESVGQGFRVVESGAAARRLRNYLLSPDRQLPVFIAGTDEDAENPGFAQQFQEAAKKWAKYTLGLATFVVLDAGATEYLEESLGDAFAPRRWAIRTYEPNIRLEDKDDARRHRFFGTERLAQWEPEAVANRLGIAARTIAHRRGTPPELRAAQLILAQKDNLHLLHGVGRPASKNRDHVVRKKVSQSIPGKAEISGGELENIQLLKEFLQVPIFSEDAVITIAERYERSEPGETATLKSVEERLRAQTDEIGDLAVEREYWEEVAAEHDQRAMQLEVDLEHTRRQIDYLRQLVDSSGDSGGGSWRLFSEVVPEDPPESFEALLDDWSQYESEGVLFTGDRSKTLELDTIDTQGRAVHAAWMSLNSLRDYLRAKRNEDFSGSVHEYLASPPSSEYTVMSIHDHAPRESESTMNQYGDHRLFRVPKSVSKSGYAEMQPHFKLGRIGMKSPRMHYMDRSGLEGKIYVGYVGVHLRTPGTN